jgi:ABC-type transport system involved in multi-copper enzyme maturation permease subunit
VNKFLAMLKDSYKEAVDGWIFTVMLVLSGIVTLLVFSISFKPTPTEQAVAKMIPTGGGPGNPGPVQTVSPDRGTGQRIIVYGFTTTAKDVSTAAKGGDPWKDDIAFTLAVSSGQFGGIGREVGEGKPNKIDFNDLFRDPFKEAVRTWAGPSEGDKPKYTDELAKEFLAAQLKTITRLNVSSVEKVGDGEFRVTTSGASSPLAWPHRPSLFFGSVPLSFLEMPLGQLIHLIENNIVNGLGAWVVLMAGVIVTAGFIPNMLRKGAIDLLLTKPLARSTILLYKYIGGLIFVFVLAAVAYGGIWLAIGLRTGVWAPGLLYCVPGVTFYFAILYGCSTLFGVLTRNAIVSIVVTIVFWFVIWLIGYVHNILTVLDNLEIQAPPRQARQKADPPKKAEKKEDDSEEPEFQGPPKPPATLVKVFKILNTFTPRTKDLDTLTGNLVSRDLLSEGEQRQEGMKLRAISWGEVLAVAGTYLVILLGLSLLRFTTRSY